MTIAAQSTVLTFVYNIAVLQPSLVLSCHPVVSHEYSIITGYDCISRTLLDTTVHSSQSRILLSSDLTH